MKSKKGLLKSLLGVTMVEILVVVGIIAIFFAILMPSLSSLNAKKRQVVCASNLRQLQAGSMAYANEFDGIWVNCFAGSASDNTLWPQVLSAFRPWYWYVKKRTEYVKHPFNDIVTNYAMGYKIGLKSPFFCPANPGDVNSVGSLQGNTTYLINRDVINENILGIRGDIVTFKDQLNLDPTDMATNSVPTKKGLLRQHIYFQGFNADSVWPLHYNGQNMVFMDGHVEFLVVGPRLSNDYYNTNSAITAIGEYTTRMCTPIRGL